MNKNTRNFMIAALISIITLLIVFGFSDFSKTVNYIARANLAWLLVALLMTILTWTFEALTRTFLCSHNSILHGRPTCSGRLYD